MERAEKTLEFHFDSDGGAPARVGLAAGAIEIAPAGAGSGG